jgi:hypothetical protein
MNNDVGSAVRFRSGVGRVLPPVFGGLQVVKATLSAVIELARGHFQRRLFRLVSREIPFPISVVIKWAGDTVATGRFSHIHWWPVAIVYGACHPRTYPYAGVIVEGNGNIYGATSSGGSAAAWG